MARKEFPGDPRRSDNVVPYTAATSNEEGSIYYIIAFVTSVGAIFLKAKWVGWISLFSSMLSVFTDRVSTAGPNGSRLSTMTLSFTALVMCYAPEVMALYKMYKGEPAPVKA